MMTFLQLVCIQLLLLVAANQILANPAVAESSDALVNTNRNYLSPYGLNYDNLEQMASDLDEYENARQHVYNRFFKRRAQAKANLAGLWGVPTRFA